MKKTWIAFFVCALFSCISCAKSDKAIENTQTAPELTDITAQAAMSGTSPTAAQGVHAYVIWHGLALWAKDGNTVVFKKRATVGDAVTIAGPSEKLSNKGTVADYIPIMMPDGAMFYTRSEYIVKADRLAVVADDKGIIYNEPRVVAATKTVIPRLTIVAIVDASIQSDFVKVTYSTPDSYIMADKFVRRESLTDKQVDIDAAVSIAVASKAEASEKARKINILEGALSVYGSSMFAADIHNELVKLGAGAALEISSYSADMIVLSDDVNVRAEPSVSSASLGKLMTDEEVSVDGRTAGKVDIGGYTDYWYRITSPIKGWVFGQFLEE